LTGRTPGAPVLRWPATAVELERTRVEPTVRHPARPIQPVGQNRSSEPSAAGPEPGLQESCLASHRPIASPAHLAERATCRPIGQPWPALRPRAKDPKELGAGLRRVRLEPRHVSVWSIWPWQSARRESPNSYRLRTVRRRAFRTQGKGEKSHLTPVREGGRRE
jgi:hypothetical protein